MAKKEVRMVAMSTLIIVLIFAMIPGNDVVAKNTNWELGAKTRPPIETDSIQPFSIFDPGFDFLDSGSAEIKDEGNGEVAISGDTYAKSYVDTVGIRFIIERWTGAAWQNYMTSVDSTSSNSTSVYAADIKQVVQGYYYRVRSVHWTIENGVREQGVLVSGSILVN